MAGANDIAVVGIACRFPGEARTPAGFFNMLKNGRNAWSKVPKDRFNIDAFYHPSNERQGSINAEGAHFLDQDLAAFDAPFFSMTASEAAVMDPQQRMLLEVSYECLESAGIPMDKLIGSDASCFIGNFTKDYEGVAARDIQNTHLYQATGNGLAMLSNRLSWFYDMHGPSLTLDTACSSSLVALHLACRSILNGESRLAMVGGTGLILVPDLMRALTSLHFLSPDSKCWSFDDRANGYSRGEGMSIILLKPVQDALRDNDTIRAVIRGSGINQDGRTPGITLPSSEAQAALIRSTYASAQLPFSDTQFFEAHGTGTPAGDPLELGALGATFGAGSTSDTPLYVGSVKANIGHLEGCAGLAGFIKAVLSLESGLIFPQLNYENPNPKLHLTEWNLKIPTEPTPWPTKGLRRASVNSFGYGGSNAHAIIDDAYNYLRERRLTGRTNTNPVVPAQSPGSSDADSGVGSLDNTPANNTPAGERDNYFPPTSLRGAKVFPISAPDQASVARVASVFSEFIGDESNFSSLSSSTFLDNLAYTLGSRRTQFPWRATVVASSAKELASALSKEVKATRSAKQAPKLAYIFTGQGAQWAAMGKELLKVPTFADAVKDADAYLKTIGADWSVIEELNKPEETSRINLPEFSQPLCTVLQIALVDLLHAWNLAPTAVVGHSSGEIAAAYCAGHVSAHDALRIAFHRGRLSGQINLKAPRLDGSMMAVGMGRQELETYLQKITQGTAVVACVNSPSNCTVSGDSSALAELEVLLKPSDVFVRRLKVSTAYHSHHMKLIAEEYRASLEGLKPSGGRSATMYSSVTGDKIEGTLLNADYWVRNMVSPVEFSAAMTKLFPTAATGGRRQRRAAVMADTIVEVGPHAALQGPIKQILDANGKSEDVTYQSTLSRGKSELYTVLGLGGRLWSLGSRLNLSDVNGLFPDKQTSLQTLTNLPNYPWNHNSTYWHESRLSSNHRFVKTARLDLLGMPVDDWNEKEPRWRNILRLSEQPWLQDHKVQNGIIYPAAGFICAVLEGAQQICDEAKTVEGFELRDVVIGRALAISATNEAVDLFLHFKQRKLGTKAPTSTWWEFTAYSVSDNQTSQHVEHCSGLLQIKYHQEASVIEGGKEAPAYWARIAEEYKEGEATAKNEIQPTALYTKLAGIGLQYGPIFQGITRVRNGGTVGCTTVTIPDTKAVMPCEFEYDHLLHPATLDACFQTIFTAMKESPTERQQAMVPTTIDSIRVSASLPKGAGAELRGFSKAHRRGFREASGSIFMSDASWEQPKIIVEGFSCTELGALTGQMTSDDGASARRKVCSYFDWQIDPSTITREDATGLLGISKENADARDETLTADTAAAEKLATVLGKRALASLTAETEAKLPTHLVQYVKWIRGRNDLAKRGAMDHQNGFDDWLTMTAEEEDAFIAESRASAIDKKLLAAVGVNLPGILDGTTPPLSVMMEDNMLFDYYANANGMDICNDFIHKWFGLKGHKSPGMKILEIGAGTASLTFPALEALGGKNGSTAHCSQYTFTDISSGFFESAQKKLKSWQDIVDYRRLDIEKDIEDQGFEKGTYDVITASNVLHATKNMSTTLKHVHELLKPGGQLILAEITHPLDCTSMIFGTLPGWWLSEDGRQGGPCMSEDEWEWRLRDAGFTMDFAIQDVPNQKNHLMSFMCATKIEQEDYVASEASLIVPDQLSKEGATLLANLTDILARIGLKTEMLTMEAASKVDDSSMPKVAGKLVISFMELDRPWLMDLTEDGFKSLQLVVQNCAGVLWLTKGDVLGSNDPHYRLITGLFRSLRSENQTLRLHELDISTATVLSENSTADRVITVFKSIFTSDSETAETEVALRDGNLHISRVLDEPYLNKTIKQLTESPAPELQPLNQPGRPLRMTIGVPGMLDTLMYIDDDEMLQPLGEYEVEFKVEASAMNFVDIMVAMGIVADTLLGVDASGCISRVGSKVTKLKVGDRIATLAMGAYRNVLRCHEDMPQKIADSMSYEDAATLPAVYVTAYQSLIEIGRLKENESILIHSAAGGLGQAAIQLAKYIGAEIFVTVGSQGKKDLIMSSYNIPEDHIFNSRDLTFAQAIMRSTNGKGVDVVLNSLAGEALRKTWECIGAFGRFIEVGKKDILGNTGLEMMPFLRNVTFAGVNVEHMFRNNPSMTAYVSKKVFELVNAGIVTVVRPVTVFKASEMETAFRTMQQGKHVGKLVLKAHDDDLVPVIPRDPHPISFKPNVTYVLAGGLGGLGRAQAIWMADNGATHIAFISRSGDAKPEAQKTLAELRSRGVVANAYKCDVADESALAIVLKQLQAEMPEIKGLIQGAMVLSDSLFVKMTYENWTAAVRPKAQGSWALHKLLPKDLDFFVLLSSTSGICGMRGQSNYSAGNNFQDALAHHRRSQGLVASVIDVGLILGFGFVEENKERLEATNTIATSVTYMGINLEEFTTLLKSAITGYAHGEHPAQTQVITGLGTGGMVKDSGLDKAGMDFYWHNGTKFSYIKRLDLGSTTQASDEGDSELREMLTTVTSLAAGVEVIQEALTAKLAKAMMIALEDIDITKPVHNYGVDSLVAVEVRNWIFRELKSDISVFDILSPVPMTQLAGKIAAKSALIPANLRAEVEGDAATGPSPAVPADVSADGKVVEGEEDDGK